MSTRTDCRRATRRFRVSESEGIWVEFVFPTPNGRRWRLPVVDLSISGFSFMMDDEFGGVTDGTNITGAALCFHGCEINGELLVMRADEDDGRTCGVLFYPREDDDLLKLKGVIAGIEAVERV